MQGDPAVVARAASRGRTRAPRRSTSARRAWPACSRRPAPAGPGSPGRWRARRRRPAARPRGSGPRCRAAVPPTPCQLGRNRASRSPGPARPRPAARPATAAAGSAAPPRRRSRGRRRRNPSGPGAARPRRAPRSDQPAERVDHHGEAQAEPDRPPRRAERAVGARIAGDQVAERVALRFEEGLGDADRQRGAERVAQPDASSTAAQRSSPATRTRITRREPSSSTSQCPTTRGRRTPRTGRRPRRAGSGRAARTRSATPSASRQRRGSSSRCSSASVRATASGSSRSRRLQPSPRPSSSASRVGSSDERGGPALGQRGVALVEELRDVAEQSATAANGDGWAVSTSTIVTSRDRILVSASTRPGTSKTSCTHSRTVSRTIGNEGYWLATWSSWAARCRCCHRGCRRSGRRRGSSRARAAHSRNRAANSAEPPISLGDQVLAPRPAPSAPGTSARPCPPGRRRPLPATRARGAPEVDPRSALELEVGQPQHDPVVAVHRLHVDPEPLAHPGRHAQRPRRVHRRAERR